MTTAPASVPTVTPVKTWTIDPSHSLVEFSLRHMMVTTVKGRFTQLSGQISYDPANLSQASVEVEIAAPSISTHDDKRDAHLRSADFLDVERFPTIRFVSTRVEPIGTDGERARVIGDLTIHGVTREVVLDAELNGSGQTPFGTTVAGFTAQTSINRKDFGLNWNVALETGGLLVGDTIKISLEIEAVAA
jgi:polyisoprenoid-binding protein YceI